MEVTLASFQASGRTDSCKDFLKMMVSGVTIGVLYSFINFGWILSGPCDLDGFSRSIAFATRFSEISIKVNVSSKSLS